MAGVWRGAITVLHRVLDETEGKTSQGSPCCYIWLPRLNPSFNKYQREDEVASLRLWLSHCSSLFSFFPFLPDIFSVLPPSPSFTLLSTHLSVSTSYYTENAILLFISLFPALILHMCIFNSMWTWFLQIILAQPPVTNYHARCFHVFDFTFAWLEKYTGSRLTSKSQCAASSCHMSFKVAVLSFSSWPQNCNSLCGEWVTTCYQVLQTA